MFQSDVVERCALVLNLGLLQGDLSPHKASLHKQPTWLTLPHKLFQDYLGGYFISKMDMVNINVKPFDKFSAISLFIKGEVNFKKTHC